jgi:hypothetical protein
MEEKLEVFKKLEIHGRKYMITGWRRSGKEVEVYMVGIGPDFYGFRNENLKNISRYL